MGSHTDPHENDDPSVNLQAISVVFFKMLIANVDFQKVWCETLKITVHDAETQK